MNAWLRAASGYLIFGWKGAIAGVLCMMSAVSLINGHATMISEISERDHRSSK